MLDHIGAYLLELIELVYKPVTYLQKIIHWSKIKENKYIPWNSLIL